MSLSEDPKFTEAMNELFTLAKMPVNDRKINGDCLLEAVNRLKIELNSSKKPAIQISEALSIPATLVVGTTGFVNYELKNRLIRFGADEDQICIKTSVEESLEEFKNRDYQLIIIDWLMSTEHEGSTVLNEIRRLSLLSDYHCHIIVLVHGGGQNNEKYKKAALTSRANDFIVLDPGWQNVLYNSIQKADFSKKKSLHF
jgi:hypothetical protein